MSALLIDSGESRVEKIDLTSSSYSDAKNKLAASKFDFEEALRILNNATTDYDEEKMIIDTNKIIIGFNLDIILALENLIIHIEHFNKANAYLTGEDVTSAKSEIKLAEDALNKATPLISSAKEKIFRIDIDTIPVESRSGILEDRNGIEKIDKILTDYSKMISGMYPFIDGMEHMLKANDYVLNEQWKSAEFEFNNSNSDIMKSKDIFIGLKNSEFSEISVSAIELDGILKKLLETLSHFETGSTYASQGNFVKANEEFTKVGQNI